MTNITYRSHLLGQFADYCDKLKLQVFEKPGNIVDLVSNLTKYQEEGEKLSPEVYVTDRIYDIAKMLPQLELLKIDETDVSLDGIRLGLKKCAPLAQDGWHIYLNESGGQLEFGVFRGALSPLAPSVEEVILHGDPEYKIVKFHQIVEGCVKVTDGFGFQKYVFFNDQKEDAKPPFSELDSMVDKLISKITKNRESLQTFLRRSMQLSISQSHGCIIAVTNMDRAPAYLKKDGIFFETPIDFSEIVNGIIRGIVDRDILDSKITLLKGMLNSDGIILFDEKCRIIGYNIFVDLKSKEKVAGGARTRAYSSLKKRLGKGLSAVFMQSHDGTSNYEQK